MPKPYKIQRLRGELAVVFYDTQGRRHRHTLGTTDEAQAELLAPAIYAEASKPRSSLVEELWHAYEHDKSGRAILKPRKAAWVALKARFAGMRAEEITVEDCRAHIAERRAAGRKDATIYNELGNLRTTLTWAAQRKLITAAPYIERPPQPAPRDERITKVEARALIDAAPSPHTKLYIVLALGTGARHAALLGLTWDRCDFSRARINFQDPTITRPHKGRAVVPMNQTVKSALVVAQEQAKTPYVIEWRGEPVKSMKRSVKSAASKAGIAAVTPHVLRHSAATWMAEDGVPMEEIAQYLGHNDINVTRKIYARYSPEYLRKAAGALEL